MSNVSLIKLIFTYISLSYHVFSLLLLCSYNVPLRREIVDLILNASEQHFHTSLNGVFSFSISCFVLEILRFFETCKLGASDVIYSRIINYTYQMVNISVNRGQKFFKFCMTIAIWQCCSSYSFLATSYSYSYTIRNLNIYRY